MDVFSPFIHWYYYCTVGVRWAEGKLCTYCINIPCVLLRILIIACLCWQLVTCYPLSLSMKKFRMMVIININVEFHNWMYQELICKVHVSSFMCMLSCFLEFVYRIYWPNFSYVNIYKNLLQSEYLCAVTQFL